MSSEINERHTRLALGHFLGWFIVIGLYVRGIPWLTEQGYLPGHSLRGALAGQWRLAQPLRSDPALEWSLLFGALWIGWLVFSHRQLRQAQAELREGQTGNEALRSKQ